MTPATFGSPTRWAPNWSRLTGSWRRPRGEAGRRPGGPGPAATCRLSGRSPVGAVSIRRSASQRGPALGSDLRQDMLGAGEIDLAGRLFDVELLDDAVLDQHRIALGAQAEAAGGGVESEPRGLGEFAVAVGEELDLAVGAR